MLSIFYSLCTIIAVAIIWFLFDYINRQFFDFFKVSDYIYWLYIPAGYRLVAVMVFGWTGALGVAIAYSIRGYLFREFSFEENIILSIMYGLAPLLACQIWKQLFNITGNLLNLTSRNLFWLSALSALLNSVFRIIYFKYANLPHGYPELWMMFVGNLLGTFAILYFIKFSTQIFRTFTKK